jgi:hypothetical protein
MEIYDACIDGLFWQHVVRIRPGPVVQIANAGHPREKHLDVINDLGSRARLSS